MLTTETYKIKQYSETPLDDLLKEMGDGRESFQTPTYQAPPQDPEPVPDPVPPADPSAPVADPSAPVTERSRSDEPPALSHEERKKLDSKREFTAKVLAKNTDRALAFVLALVADDDDIDHWKANDDDLTDIREAYFEMCVNYGWGGIPPWMLLLMSVGLTYGPRFKEAANFRKEQEREASAEAEKELMRKRLLDPKLAKLKSEEKSQENDPVQTELSRKVEEKLSTEAEKKPVINPPDTGTETNPDTEHRSLSEVEASRSVEISESENLPDDPDAPLPAKPTWP